MASNQSCPCRLHAAQLVPGRGTPRQAHPLHVFHRYVRKRARRPPTRPPTLHLAKQYVLRQPMIFHAPQVPQPPQSILLHNVRNRQDVASVQKVLVGEMLVTLVHDGQPHDAAQAPHVKNLHALRLELLQCPRLTAIQQVGQHLPRLGTAGPWCAGASADAKTRV